MKNTKEVKKLKLKLLGWSALLDLIIIICLDLLMPIIFNYPPFTQYDLKFQSAVDNLNHAQQYIIVFLITTTFFTIISNFMLRKIYRFLNKFYKKEPISDEEIKQVRKHCFNIPYLFYICSIIIIGTVGIGLSLAFEIAPIILIKFCFMLFSLVSLIALLQFMFLQRTLKKINILTCSVSSNFEKNTGFRIKFSSNLIIQMLPFLLVLLILISLIGYAKATKEKGVSVMNYYKAYLDNRDFSNVNISDLKAELNTIPLLSESDYYIIISPNKEIIYTSDPEIEVSNFFLTYLDHYFYKTNGLVYEYYGIEQQAYMIELHDENDDLWYIGFEYLTSDQSLMSFYIVIIFVVGALYFIFLYIWSQNTATNISTISEALDHIVQENDYSSQKFLPIFSNDEFGDLAYSYNKIEELTTLHLKEIQNNQEMLVEQERLASLGQMIGGIAHNLKTPIFSVAGGLEGLSDLINEYDASIDNPSVTNQDMHEIAQDMREWIDKLKGHMSYMSDVITAVKGQTVTLADNAVVEFSVAELFKRVDILMKHELKNALATLQIENNVSDKNLLAGNINSLVQIINNIISNSIEAYENKATDKKIELSANVKNNNILISVKDYGPGISEVAQKKLFKEMITTKGKNGTGLGMFMSYSNIKAHFNGNLTYETELGKGTTFYITLPIKN